ncbi:hypothetical protein BV25DRAFT_1807123, partial [Artomyces pyxidatus]
MASNPSDTLPSNVPNLDSRGLNWTIFYTRFELAAKAKGLWNHFDGSTPHPSIPASPSAVEQWDKDENTALYLLSQRVPDSTLIMLRKRKTAAEQWSTLVAEYTRKSAYAQTTMRHKFL